MSITYSAGAGTTVTEFAFDCTLGDQAQQTGNNTVVVPNVISGTGTNGQIGTKFSSFVGRLIIIQIAGTQQIRMVTAEAAGTSSTRILTVNENWTSNPVSGNTLHAFYDVDDIETGGAGGGVALSTKTGLYEFSNKLTIGDGTLVTGLQINTGIGYESNDGGATLQNIVKNNGYLYLGYLQAGNPVAGGINTFYNNGANEPTWQWQSGSKGLIADSLLWGQLAYALFYECASGSAVIFNNSKLINLSYASTFFGATLLNCSILGRAATTELIRLSSTSTVNGLYLVRTGGLATASGDTSTESITVKNAVWISNAYYISVNSNKTWYIINPSWLVSTYTDLNWLTSTANYVYDQRSIDAIVQKPDGTKLQNANVLIYENAQLDDLVLETYTNSSGIATGAFTYKKHSTNSATLTYGGHALRVDCWGYVPYISTQISTSYFNGTVVLNTDNNITASSQSSALSSGSGITWNKDTNPSSAIKFTGGSGTLSVGNTVTQATTGASGIVTKIVDGDSTAGTVHLKTRNATAFSNGYGLSNGSGWTATYTNDSQQNFTIWIDANSLSMQTVYDYLAALTSQTTLSATGELIHEWGRDSQVRAFYLGQDGFYTERSYGKGVFVTNYGVGTLDYFTDDNGNTLSVAQSVTLTIKCVDKFNNPINGIRCYIEDGDNEIVLLNKESANVGGNDGITEEPYFYYGTPVDVIVRLRKSPVGGTRYLPFDTVGTIEGNFNLTVVMYEDTNI